MVSIGEAEAGVRWQARRFKVARSWIRDDTGAASVYFTVIAVAVVFASFLVVDGGRKMSRISQAVNLADNGARACAQAVSPASLLEAGRDGDPVLDQAAAVARADRYFRQAGVATYEVAFDSGGTRCLVTVTLDVPTIAIPMDPVSSTQAAVGRTG